jgi:hypothetical protein
LNDYAAENGDLKVPRMWSIIISLFIPFQLFILFMWWLEQAGQANTWYKVDEVKDMDKIDLETPEKHNTVSGGAFYVLIYDF